MPGAWRDYEDTNWDGRVERRQHIHLKCFEITFRKTSTFNFCKGVFFPRLVSSDYASNLGKSEPVKVSDIFPNPSCLCQSDLLILLLLTLFNSLYALLAPLPPFSTWVRKL